MCKTESSKNKQRANDHRRDLQLIKTCVFAHQRVARIGNAASNDDRQRATHYRREVQMLGQCIFAHQCEARPPAAQFPASPAVQTLWQGIWTTAWAPTAGLAGTALRQVDDIPSCKSSDSMSERQKLGAAWRVL